MRLFGLVMIAVCSCAPTAVAVPTVYSGFEVSFAKLPFADPLLAPNFDPITASVALSRGDTGGVFNIVQELSFISNTSPTGTAWAFQWNNPGKTITATNWADLSFTDWQTSLGGGGRLATNITASSGVLHLSDDDIYLDIRFTSWGMGSTAGGSFAYERAAVVPVPEPACLVLMGLASLTLLTHRRR